MMSQPGKQTIAICILPNISRSKNRETMKVDQFYDKLKAEACNFTCTNDTKLILTSKFMMSQPGKQTIAICILPNISRSKNRETMKVDQFYDKLKATEIYWN